MESKNINQILDLSTVKFERMYYVEMKSRLPFIVKVDLPGFNHIWQNFHFENLTDEKNQTITKYQSQTKMNLFVLKMIWLAKVQMLRSMRMKPSKKSLQDWSISRSEIGSEAIMMQKYR